MNRVLTRVLGLIFVFVIGSIIPFGFAAAETQPPTSTVTTSPVAPDGENSWYTVPVEINFASTDLESGVRSIAWRQNQGLWNVNLFENTVNLAPNPSFEDNSTPPISNWVFQGLPGSSGIRDTSTAKFETASGRIISSQNGWSSFSNSSDYIPADPFANMTASVWLRTSAVAGTGAYFKIYALHSQGATLITTSNFFTGTNDWLRVARNFYVSVNDAYGIYFEIGIDGIGTVWYDGLSVSRSVYDTSVLQTFSQNGQHQIEYYAVDNQANTETPVKSLNVKIDTGAPTNWRGFSTDQVGNDHTLKAEITVDDQASGINGTAGFFQYSVDGGVSWGYYSNLTSCSSSWVSGGWKGLETELENGGKTAELETPAVDYCNSNWVICKIVRFKTEDNAGNTADKEVCINGAWFRATGDVGSRAGISLSSAGSSDNSDGVIFSATTIDNFTSSKGTYVTNYLLPQKLNYSSWYALYPTTTPMPAGKLPKTSGIFLNNGSFTISSSTIPTNFGSSIFSAVVYINGDLTINREFEIAAGSGLVFIVSGDVNIDKNVRKISAFIISDGEIDASYNGNSGEALVVKGSFIAESVSLNRSLNGEDNESKPMIDIIYQPAYLTVPSPLLGPGEISWREVSL